MLKNSQKPHFSFSKFLNRTELMFLFRLREKKNIFKNVILGQKFLFSVKNIGITYDSKVVS